MNASFDIKYESLPSCCWAHWKLVVEEGDWYAMRLDLLHIVYTWVSLSAEWYEWVVMEIVTNANADVDADVLFRLPFQIFYVLCNGEWMCMSVLRLLEMDFFLLLKHFFPNLFSFCCALSVFYQFVRNHRPLRSDSDNGGWWWRR